MAIATTLPAPALLERFPLLAPLTIRNFRLYWVGRSISLAGDQFQMVALAVVALDLTHSAAGLGSVLMVQAVPRAVLMLLGGVATDRFRARSVMLIADTLQTVVVSVLALLAFRGALTFGTLLAYAAVSGTVYAFFLPASNTIIPELVPRERVLQANALSSTAFNLNLFLMPPLAGLTVALLGPAPAFGLNALSFLGSVLTLWRIRQPARPNRPTAGRSPLRRMGHSLTAARRDGPIWLTMGMALVYCFGFQGATTLGLPALAKLSLGAGDPGVGLLYGARGIGALVAGLLLGSFAGAGRTGLLGCFAILGISLTVVAGGLAPSLGAALPAFMLSGLCASAVGTLFITLVQTRAPEEQRGGIMALLSLTIFGLSQLALGLAGLVGAALSPRLILVGGGVLMGLAGLWGLSSREMRAAQ